MLPRRQDAARQSLVAFRSGSSWRGAVLTGSPRPSNKSLGRTPQRSSAARTDSFEQPAKQWNRIARRPRLTPSDGVRSSCAGQRHMPLARRQLPPSLSTISRARRSSRSGAWVWGKGRLHRGPALLRAASALRLCRRFLQAMFYICSHAIRPAEESQMIRISIGAAAGAALALASAAGRAETGATAPDTNSPTSIDHGRKWVPD